MATVPDIVRVTLATDILFPSEMTGVLLKYLQNHFTTTDLVGGSNIINTQLKGFLWNSDPSLSKIVIAPLYLRDKKIANKRPAIYVARNSTEVTIPGSDDVSVISGSTTIVDGSKYMRLMPCKHVVYCVGNNGEETEQLSDEVFLYLTAAAKVLRTNFKLDSVEVMNLSQSKKLDNVEIDNELVPIVVSWTGRFSYTLGTTPP